MVDWSWAQVLSFEWLKIRSVVFWRGLQTHIRHGVEALAGVGTRKAPKTTKVDEGVEYKDPLFDYDTWFFSSGDSENDKKMPHPGKKMQAVKS